MVTRFATVWFRLGLMGVFDLAVLLIFIHALRGTFADAQHEKVVALKSQP